MSGWSNLTVKGNQNASKVRVVLKTHTVVSHRILSCTVSICIILLCFCIASWTSGRTASGWEYRESISSSHNRNAYSTSMNYEITFKVVCISCYIFSVLSVKWSRKEQSAASRCSLWSLWAEETGMFVCQLTLVWKSFDCRVSELSLDITLSGNHI